MTALWITLAVLTIIAVAIVLLPMLMRRRDDAGPHRQGQNIDIFRDRLAELEGEREAGTLTDDDFVRLKLELERNLLSESGVGDTPELKIGRIGRAQLFTVALLALLVPIIALPMYDFLGHSDALAESLNPPPQPKIPATLEQAISELKAKLKENPDSAEGWFLLGRTSMSIGRYQDGLNAYKKLAQLTPKTSPQYATVMGQLAQAMFYASNMQMTDAVHEQIDKTLKVDPNEVTALGLLGIDAFSSQDYRRAIETWTRAYNHAQGDARNSLKQGILRARAQLQAEGGELPPLPQGLLTGTVSVEVSLASELAAKAKPDQTVFVFARKPGGSMPIVATRTTVADLPVTLTLDDSMALRPSDELSAHDQVEVGARISVSGSANSSSGDLVTNVAKVSVGKAETPVKLVINKVVE